MCRLIVSMSSYCKDPRLYRQLPPRLLILPGAEPQSLVANREMREHGFLGFFLFLVLISTEEDQPGHVGTARYQS